MRATSAFVQDFLQRIYDNGDVYQDVYAGLYCVGCEAFKTEAELVDGKCPDHEVEPEWIEEQNYFFRLSAYQERCSQLYDERPDFVLPGFRYNEARSFIAGGLQDFSISRAGQSWGVPIPWDPEQVAYVWADALVNYLQRARRTPGPGEDLAGRFWPDVRHLLGEGHPSLPLRLLAGAAALGGLRRAEAALRARLSQLDDRKISKSLGNVVDPLDLIGVYGVDAVRFWAARSVSFGQDGNVALETLRERYERELGNDLGNLVSRTTAMIARYRGGELARVDADAPWDAEALRDELVALLDRYDITNALDAIWRLVRRLNQYVEETAPWQLAKDDARALELDRVLYDLADGLRRSPSRSSRTSPTSAPRILAALGQPADDLSLAPHPRGHGRGGDRDRGRAAALPAHRRSHRRVVIDTHAHLDACAEPAEALVARARAAGVTRIVTVGTGIESCRAALAIADAHEGVYAALGIDPHQAGAPEAGRLDELRALLAHPKAVAVGETGLDGFHDFADRADAAARLFERAARARRASSGKPRRRSTRREADAETAAALAGFAGTVVLHCFSQPGLLAAALERGYYVSFAGNVTYPKRRRAARGRGAGAGRPDPRRDRQPVPRAAAAARAAERAGERRPHARRPRRGARRRSSRARGADRRERDRRLRACRERVRRRSPSASTSSSTRTSSA